MVGFRRKNGYPCPQLRHCRHPASPLYQSKVSMTCRAGLSPELNAVSGSSTARLLAVLKKIMEQDRE